MAGTHTCDGLCVPAVWRRLLHVKLAHFAFAHILLFVGGTLLRVGVGVGVGGRGQGGGRGCQLGSPLTVREMKGPWASGAAAPPAELNKQALEPGAVRETGRFTNALLTE